MRMRYKISIKALQGDILTFTTSDYNIIEGFVSFTDEKTGIGKKFHSTNCEIQEVE